LRRDPASGVPELIWRTQEDGREIDYDSEPAHSTWQRMEVEFLTLLPLDKEL